ncbi:MAG: hypothetical protein R3F14_06230 [Polyangiaceae bacterium]
MGPLETDLEQKYMGQGFHVLGFYSNDFKQGGDPDACTGEYNVTFPQFVMGHVRYGKQEDVDGNPNTPPEDFEPRPVFKWLIDTAGAPAPDWNFHKYLIARDGTYVAHWSSAVTPTSAQVISAIEAELAKPKP